MKDCRVSSRSRYSSMSRLTNVRGIVASAQRYNVRSRSQIRSIEWSNAKASRFATIADTFTDT